MQEFAIYNLDKEEYIVPHVFKDNSHFMGFASEQEGINFAFAILLSSGNGRGGGDINVSNHKLCGHWSGDRVVTAGNYDDFGKFLPDDWQEKLPLDKYIKWHKDMRVPTKDSDWKDGKINLMLYSVICDWRDISIDVLQLIAICGERYKHEYKCVKDNEYLDEATSTNKDFCPECGEKRESFVIETNPLTYNCPNGHNWQ